MKIAIPRECRPGETRVAASPEVVKKLAGFSFDVAVEKGAGEAAAITDANFKDAGATIAEDATATYKNADIVLKIQRPVTEGAEGQNELSLIKKGAVVLAHMAALTHKEDVAAMAEAGITAFAMELMPRITRAQSMDILSSQSNLAGYKAVLDGAAEYGSAFPMMMTAAGTVPPAKVFIMGVGVAGLQAIATAKRLGAIVTATDVRPATKEQVESLGGKFLEVDPEMEKNAQTEGGYAKEMPPEYFEKQKQVVSEHIKSQDLVITTALIPGRSAPVLVTEDMVKTMNHGSVIVDLAVEAGGNCPLSQLGEVVVKHGVTLVGHDNVPGRLAKDASLLFAKNLLNFLSPHVDQEKKDLNFDWEDETVAGTLLCRDGKVIHPMFTGGE
ncbi:MAG: Re/Si-specific NAD(P)(+) transhydrogenase subunit alpha [Alphaproteobacteria bacterium]|jgi:NAD(P) transhydrogenase subunit alpha|nr:NAD(P)(+) transhydrogenase (Re/Si-specific) subunit alpha [Rhodospirillaceae bacterium]MDP6660311.1 Re/Si-specific NAD(P)(+) transhydrogenase subunit alpha [Alphaproteobacteria bacterium]MDP6780351.1 Re/Si-specific NAD(P)(+) transhydrogenase subunit alpha [Alphaproteobacteria bacterium]MDP7044217.1 Re/Si-specific NAD(P)(+) transhydrogenase subunit alpha [Alphaproteobacteria bacterium]HAQ32509.1 Re/Si-specific NAD(P)(+) transhydrogenase subunit alpha [Rhodospirillaceae bacterium]|tara:strand:+ start:1792 stop:2946 length:1155 start_codon:yes stop_codon:yes gene_type:complete